MVPRVRVLVALALVVSVVGACDDGGDVGPGPHGEAALKHARDVGGDRGATAKEVIGAGGPVDINVSGDRTMVTWDARDFEYGEGSHESAWGLYDGRGHRIAQGKLKWYAKSFTVHTVADGFVIKQTTRTPYWEHVDHDGHVTRLEVSDDPQPSRAGDVGLGFVDNRRPAVYRAGHGDDPGTVVRLNRVPGNGYSPQLAVAADGSLWVMDPTQEAVIRWSADGREPWHTEQVPIPARARGSQLEVIGKHAYLVAVRATSGRNTALESLWERPLGPGADWTRVPTDGVELSAAAHLAPTDRQLVLSEITSHHQTGYVLVGDSWTSFPLAEGTGQEHEEVVRSIGDAIYLYRGQLTNLRVSRDNGKTWKYVAR